MSPNRSSSSFFLALVATIVIVATTMSPCHAFAPPTYTPRASSAASSSSMNKQQQQIINVKTLHMGFFNDEERKPLTRDSEPEEFFKTNTDKMSDEEKIPIAVMGLVGISAPFILGLIALYAARY